MTTKTKRRPRSTGFSFAEARRAAFVVGEAIDRGERVARFMKNASKLSQREKARLVFIGALKLLGD